MHTVSIWPTTRLGWTLCSENLFFDLKSNSAHLFIDCHKYIKSVFPQNIPNVTYFPAFIIFFFIIRPPLGLLPVLGPLEQYMTPTLDAALLCSSWAGSDLGCRSDWLRSLYNVIWFWLTFLLLIEGWNTSMISSMPSMLFVIDG